MVFASKWLFIKDQGLYRRVYLSRINSLSLSLSLYKLKANAVASCGILKINETAPFVSFKVDLPCHVTL